MRKPANPRGLPRQRRGTTPQMVGRYPDYDVLDEAPHWDPTTHRLVLRRIEQPPALRFFSETEARTLEAFCDTVMAQDAEPRIPVLAMVDEKLFEARLDGYQYATMPDDRETWRLVARGLDEAAGAHGAETFADAPVPVRLELVSCLAHGRLHGDVWEQVDAALAWKVVMRSVLEAFYSHPWAWNEIGWGGPSYPRGYARLGIGLKESWEGEEAFALDPVDDVAQRGVDL